MFDPYKFIQDFNFERLAGSANEKKAAKIIVKTLESFGLTANKERFSLFSFDLGKGFLQVGSLKLNIKPFGLENSSETWGKLLFIDNPEKLKYHNKAYKDAIILSYSYSRKVLRYIENSDISAFVAIGSPYKPASSHSHRQYNYKALKIPCASISYSDAEKLLPYNGEMTYLRIKQTTEKRFATNIIADIKGHGIDDNLVMATAHYDTVAESCGSTDNAGGTAALLKIAEYFSNNKPQRNLRLIFFSGEELGLLGSLNYTKKHKREIKDNLQVVVNVDVSGDPIGIDKYIITGTNEILGYIDGISRENGLLFKKSLDIYSSDNMPFTVFGIPSVNIARFGGRGSVMAHTKNDNPANVYPPGLDNTIKAGILVIKRLVNSEIFPIDKKIDKSLKEKIEKYLQGLTGKKHILEW